MMKINIFRVVTLSLFALMLNGCGKSSSSPTPEPTPTPPPPPPAVAPTTPAITAPTGGTVDSNVVLKWSWNQTNGVAGDSWSVIDNNSAGSVFSQFDVNNPDSQSGSAPLNLSTGQHTLKVNLCNSNGCSLSAPVTVTVDTPPPPPPSVPAQPTITSPTSGYTSTNPSVSVSWTSHTVGGVANGYWQLITDGAYGARLNYTDGQSQQTGTTTATLPVGSHTLAVSFCNSLSQCTVSAPPVTVTISQSTQKLPFISYWTSWSQTNDPAHSLYQYPNLSNVPDGVTHVFVAFALENSNSSAMTLQLNPETENQFKQDIKTLQSKGIKVVVSTGGASSGDTAYFPWENPNLSNATIIGQYEDFVKFYGFDGLDFDVETYDKNIVDKLEPIIQQLNTDLKKWKADFQFSYTVAVDSDGIPHNPGDYRADLAKYLLQNKLITYVNIMNYDSFWTPATCTYTATVMSKSCYVQNIEATKLQIVGWNIGINETQAKALISNGIMIGMDDSRSMSYAVTLDIATNLTQWLKQNNYGAVMTWALTRDQPGPSTDLNLYTGLTGADAPAAKAFTNTIISATKN